MNMKRIGSIGLALACALLLAGCGNAQSPGSKAAASNSTTVSDVLESAMKETDANDADTNDAAEADAADTLTPTEDVSPSEAAAAPETPVPDVMDLSSEDADIDLTLLSGTMVYSEVSQMVYNPEEFLGKTVKMQGTFAIYEGETRNYYACLISDATACCANGIEFEWAGDHTYPDDYPELGTEITVVGTFDMYEEDGFQYIQLSDADLGI